MSYLRELADELAMMFARTFGMALGFGAAIAMVILGALAVVKHIFP